MNHRKPRKDSKLHNLPPDQRARVDKWLFDKCLTYQQVAEGCLKMFGLNISKSSVGRYHESESRRRMRVINTGLQPGEERPNASATASAVFRFFRKPLKRLSSGTADVTGLKPGVNESVLSFEEGFQELLTRLTKRALDLTTYLELEWDAEGARELLRLVRVLIAARRAGRACWCNRSAEGFKCGPRGNARGLEENIEHPTSNAESNKMKPSNPKYPACTQDADVGLRTLGFQRRSGNRNLSPRFSFIALKLK